HRLQVPDITGLGVRDRPGEEVDTDEQADDVEGDQGAPPGSGPRPGLHADWHSVHSLGPGLRPAAVRTGQHPRSADDIEPGGPPKNLRPSPSAMERVKRCTPVPGGLWRRDPPRHYRPDAPDAGERSRLGRCFSVVRTVAVRPRAVDVWDTRCPRLIGE